MKRASRVCGGKLSLLAISAAVVCLGQLPPSDAGAYAAKVVTQSGQVSILKDSQPWALSVGDSVHVQDLIVTGPDGHALLQVSDGSAFEVYPNSRVVFRKNPPNWRDFLDVLVGRVRIHIEHLGNVPNPNRILTPTAVISVRGTIFDVSVNDDDETTLVEVEEGTVEVQHALLPRGNPKVLNSGDTLKVYRDEPLEAGLLDKGTVARQVLRAVVNAAATYLSRAPRLGSPGGVLGAGGAAGDTQKIPPPPPPPPAPSAPPPPPPRVP
jgi:FecR protein